MNLRYILDDDHKPVPLTESAADWRRFADWRWGPEGERNCRVARTEDGDIKVSTVLRSSG